MFHEPLIFHSSAVHVEFYPADNIYNCLLSFLQSDLESFSGHIQYPLPNKRATASRIGYGGNAIVFVVFHAGKEFAVKKVGYFFC